MLPENRFPIAIGGFHAAAHSLSGGRYASPTIGPGAAPTSVHSVVAGHDVVVPAPIATWIGTATPALFFSVNETRPVKSTIVFDEILAISLPAQLEVAVSWSVASSSTLPLVSAVPSALFASPIASALHP